MNTPECVLSLVFIAFWVLGIAVAKGFWMIAAMVIFPPYAWVVATMWIIEKLG